MNRYPITLFYMIFVYVSGLLVRFATYEGDPFSLLVSSLMIDTILIGTIAFSVRLVLTPLSDKLTTFQIVPVSLVLAPISALAGMILTDGFRHLTHFWPDRFFEWWVAWSYFTLLAAIYNLQFLWVRNAQLTEQRTLDLVVAERLAAQSELRRLRTQMQPHFLFNVLNNLRIEIGNSPAQAADMVTVLVDHLRRTLALEDTLYVTLDSDIEGVGSFVNLQKMRFGVDIRLQLDVANDAAQKMVPTFLLLPLIENATKFGDRFTDGELVIKVVAHTDGDTLKLSVSQLGNLATRKKDVPGTGTGLPNLRARLALHYPNRHSFSLVQRGAYVVAEITLSGDPC